jgi:hypothetical protein
MFLLYNCHARYGYLGIKASVPNSARACITPNSFRTRPRDSSHHHVRNIPLKPVLRRRRRGTPRHAPRIATTLLEPLARAHVQLAIQLGTRFLAMDKVAEAAAHAALARVEATTRLAEVRHGRQFAVDGAAGVPARVEGVARFLRVFFVLEAHVDVADEICKS